ncbi:MAG: flagellar protein [Rhodovulum sulfidophilum]|uniref:Flagellar protein n=1 Tax=Rhodovulum sulfidophilum TaxID=35806 RepID=A0A2W5NFV4_RHOSU|nr:MAG: flagellar protein [Rhodovulum sulfidophilum]
MSYQPRVPLSGIAGWRVLQRSEASQRAAFDKSADVKADLAYFEAKIGSVAGAEDLMADRRLLKVALGAFGLDEWIDRKAFIRKVLEEGTTDPRAFANRLTEPSFRKLSAAFGFGDAGGARTGTAGFAAKISEAYGTRAFEAAVGATDNDMRLALNFRREIADLAGTAGGKGGSWYSIIGSKTLSTVARYAFGLPKSFGTLDVDKQRDILMRKAEAVFGSSDLSLFQDPAKVAKFIDRFLARSQLENGSTSTAGASPALTLLRPGGSGGSQGLLNLLMSLR